MGVESIAVDPSAAGKVYLACGTYSAPDLPDGAVLRSTDRGRTFQRTNLPVKNAPGTRAATSLAGTGLGSLA
jgi:hypothetical protein